MGTSRGTPRFKLPYRYHLLRLLAPSREAFETEDDQEFERVYLGQLEKLGVDRIANQLGRISHEHDGKPLALLCFENVLKGEACHRRAFADWWKEQTGQDVPELDKRVEVEPRTPPVQAKLFRTNVASLAFYITRNYFTLRADTARHEETTQG